MHRAVQPPVPRGRGVHRVGDLVLVGDVGGLIAYGALGLERRYLLDGRREPIGVAPDDHDGGPGGYQPGGHPLADSAATAGDQVGPVFERKLHASPFTAELKQVLAIEPCEGRCSSRGRPVTPATAVSERRGTPFARL